MLFSVGIDVSSGKSNIAIICVDSGDVIRKDWVINHIKSDFDSFVSYLYSLDGEVKIVMEATGVYHLQLLDYLLRDGFFVSVINALMMKKFISSLSLRSNKNDNADAIAIATYGVEKWNSLRAHYEEKQEYQDLRSLSREYHQLVVVRTKLKIQMQNALEKIFPKFRTCFKENQFELMLDVLEKYSSSIKIIKIGIDKFTMDIIKMAKKKGHHSGAKIASRLFDCAQNNVQKVAPSNANLVALTTILGMLRASHVSIQTIINEMEKIAITLPEYDIAINMPGVGKIMAPQLMAEIGDIKKFKSKRSLIAYAGIDVPVYQSGKFTATNMHISRKGSATLRRVGFLIITFANREKSKAENEISKYLDKKVSEGKHFKVAVIAALNKFLRIYYSRVKEIYA